MFDLLAPKFGILELSCSGKLLLLEKKQSELQWLLAVLLKLSTALARETELVHTEEGRDGSLVFNALLSSCSHPCSLKTWDAHS